MTPRTRSATAARSWRGYFAAYLPPTLLGNVVGGVSMAAFFNHAQVIAEDSG
jgi:formate/nitrite transporter FocA (FNT family)